jgi:DNA-binding Lrp family transcriptional regulator
MTLDKINCNILNVLQKNSRTTLTKLAKEIGLSVDSTKKRLTKLMAGELFYSSIQMRPRHFGYETVVDIKIKLYNYEQKEYELMIDWLTKNPFVVELISLSGEWDLTIVLIAKDALDLGVKTDQIRNKFGNIISQWSQSITTKVYKFEEYDMNKLILENKQNE